ncbi:MAG: ABC transporter permease [Armatimonadetes bacterium]|nr:ABC transporter permease [Armatimonadota bacterium]
MKSAALSQKGLSAGILRPVLTAVAGLAGVAVIILLTGASPVKALSALAEGSFGSLYSATNTFAKMCPLLLTGLSVGVAFRCRIWNIGAEGQFLMGALAAAWVGVAGRALPPPLLLPLTLLSGVLFGALWGGVVAALRLWRGVQEVISTIMLNFIALQIVSFAVQGPLQEAKKAYPQTDPIALGAELPLLVSGTNLHWGVPIALAVAACMSVFLFKTAAGFQIRAVGSNAEGAGAAGIRVSRIVLLTMLLSGGLSGLAGAVELTGITHQLFESFSPGYGYTAIAVALLGGLHPVRTVFSALFFGALAAGSNQMERAAGVSSVLVYVIQGATVAALVGYLRFSLGTRQE